MSSSEIPLISHERTETSANKNEETMHESNTVKERFTFRIKALKAWRFTVASGVLAGTIILLVNILTLAVIYGRHSPENHSIVFFTGKCSIASGVSTTSHLIINTLSTILLAYSNFSMQCLGSPTRKEIDSAHQKHEWLTIGVPSIRNLFFKSKTKIAMWLLLVISSFPLHMIWNSTVFKTKNSYDYFALSVNEEFFHGALWSPIKSPSYKAPKWNDGDLSELVEGFRNAPLSPFFKRLNTKDCIHEYYKEYRSDRRHVLVVSESGFHPYNSSVGPIYTSISPERNEIPPRHWMCGRTRGNATNPPSAERAEEECPLHYDNWHPGFTDDGNYSWANVGKVLYCYSEIMPPKCKVSIVPAFLIIVICCNLVKIICFAGVLYITKSKQDPSLCTTGDAIQSFLKRPDPYTRGRCLAERNSYKRGPKANNWIPRPVAIGDAWTGGRRRWVEALGLRQWLSYTLTTMSIWCAMVPISVLLLPKRNLDINEAHASDRVSSRFGVLSGFLLGNIPQVVVSYLYLASNNILSTMLAMADWCKYGTEGPKKGLRVSSPVRNSAQRSKYFLSIPYKWAIPSTVALTLLHWLASQAFFFANIDIYRMLPRTQPQIGNTLGYLYSSALAVYLTTGIGFGVSLAYTLIALFRKYPANIPLSGCSSASIAAACQPSGACLNEESTPCEFDPDLSCQKLKWGVVESPDANADQVGHATFTAGEATALIKGEMYA